MRISRKQTSGLIASACCAADAPSATLCFTADENPLLHLDETKLQEEVAAVVAYVLIVGAAFGMRYVFSGRAVFIHVGAILGTIMAANVWMRIWPNQRKIITAVNPAALSMATRLGFNFAKAR